ncbi:MAG: peptidoglycan DD-metalloendopeptidase family protein [Bdellovibrionales bacterium]|nr:peptidoglycan DD-metalloendopeptidase family protein [Bdellovibrionales bacterium]
MSFFILGITFGFSQVRAEELPTSNPQLNKSVADYKKFKDKSEELKEKERELLSTVYKITRRQRKLASNKAALLQKREALESDISGLQKNISEVSEDIKKTKKQIITRLRNLQRVNAPTLFQSIFGAQDVMEMDRNARVMYRISRSDVDQLRVYQGLKNLLFQQQETLKSKLSAFEKNQIQLENEEQSIKSTYQAKMNLLQRLDNEDKKILITLKKIREKTKTQMGRSSQFEDLSVVFDGGIFEQKGKLPMPTMGVVTQKFGIFNLLSDKIKIYNKGWFVSTTPGKEIKSIFKGRVIFSGDLPDRHRVVIVDHGDHFYSVYSNLEVAEVAVNDEIEAEEQIGRAGSSRFFGHGLYLEIRHFSQPEDPTEWFRDGGMNISSLKEQDI